jgi:predicted chitinase
VAVKLNINNAIDLFKSKGGDTTFEYSLRKTLEYAEKDKRITSLSDLAYLLATAEVESNYSLQRWEADYLCGKQGYAYQDKPCQKALDYYKSTNGGKQNYYNLGTDKRGLPYFGRGLIQLTGKSNYDTYGKKVGVDLLNNPDKALQKDISYDVAVAYMTTKRGGYSNKSTFDLAKEGNFSSARKSVKGSSSGYNSVKADYDKWMSILEDKKVNAKVVNGSTSSVSKQKQGKKIILATFISLTMIGNSIYAYSYFKKK